MSEAPRTHSTGPMGWSDTMPPEQIEARTHPMPNLHDQDEVDHIIHSTFPSLREHRTRQEKAPHVYARRPVSQTSWRMSCCVKLLASLAGGYAFGAAIVALSNF